MRFSFFLVLLILNCTGKNDALSLLERIAHGDSTATESYEISTTDTQSSATTAVLSSVTTLALSNTRASTIDPSGTETKKTVIVGGVAIGLLLLMASVAHFFRKFCCDCCCPPQVENEKEAAGEEETDKTPEASDEIYVHYDLWEKEPEVKTISGTIARLTAQDATRHIRPKDPRTVTSYRRSFRQFVKERGGSTSSDGGLPRYYDITKNMSVTRDLPPSYGDLPSSSGHVNETFSENE